jgi:hypothetical protein
MRILAATILAVLAFAGTAEAATRYVTPTGTGSTCTQAQPCKTLAAGYTAAASGDTIEVAGGIYPRQDIPAGTKFVIFHGATGVQIRQLYINAANTVLDGINVDAGGAKTTGAALEHAGANTLFKNAYVGNVTDEKGALIHDDAAGSTFENVHFRDAKIATDGVHNECIYAMAPNLTFRNSRWTGCTTYDLFFARGTWWGQPAYGGMRLLGNFFGKTFKLGGAVHYNTVKFGTLSDPDGDITGAEVRGNTFELPAVIDPDAVFIDSVESCNTPDFDFPGIKHEACDPVPTPTPTPTPTATATPTATPTPTPTPTATPTPTPYEPACEDVPECMALRAENAELKSEVDRLKGLARQMLGE